MNRFSSTFSIWIAATMVVAQAASPLGSIQASGEVAVSGTRLSTAGVPSWPIVVGDRVVTEAGGIATVSSPLMGRVEIRQSSSVRLADGHVELERGAVGSQGSAVRFGEVTVEARDRDASSNWFVVANQAGQQLIAAHRGDVWIRSKGVAPLLLPAGSYAVPASPPDSGKGQGDAAKDKKDRRKKGGAATAGAAAGWTIGSLSHAASIAVIAGVGAAAATGAAVGFTGSDEIAPVRSDSAP